MLSLDHVSLRASPAELERRGFRVTPTAGAHGQHARVMLDRSYLELTWPGTSVTNVRISQVNDEGGPGPRSRGPRTPGGKRSPLSAVGWFVRSDGQDALLGRLRASGVAVPAPAPYAGRDGEWLDLKLPGAAVVTPIVTRRTDRDDWPPALTAPHPNGATSITRLRVSAQRPRALRAVLTAAGASERGSGRIGLCGAELEIETGRADALTAIILGDSRGGELVLALADRPG